MKRLNTFAEFLKESELQEMAQITKKGKTVYADGQPLRDVELETVSKNITMYHEKVGNFFIAKDRFFVYFTSTEDWVNKVSDGEYHLLMFPIKTLGNAFTLNPITDVWKISKAPGRKEVLGMIEGLVDGGDVVIKMMSVRGPWKGNRINSLMIDAIREEFPDKRLVFQDPTDQGFQFIASYAPDAYIEDDRGKELKIPQKFLKTA
jgi:hypothetical protein